MVFKVNHTPRLNAGSVQAKENEVLRICKIAAKHALICKLIYSLHINYIFSAYYRTLCEAKHFGLFTPNTVTRGNYTTNVSEFQYVSLEIFHCSQIVYTFVCESFSVFFHFGSVFGQVATHSEKVRPKLEQSRQDPSLRSRMTGGAAALGMTLGVAMRFS